MVCCQLVLGSPTRVAGDDLVQQLRSHIEHLSPLSEGSFDGCELLDPLALAWVCLHWR